MRIASGLSTQYFKSRSTRMIDVLKTGTRTVNILRLRMERHTDKVREREREKGEERDKD